MKTRSTIFGVIFGSWSMGSTVVSIPFLQWHLYGVGQILWCNSFVYCFDTILQAISTTHYFNCHVSALHPVWDGQRWWGSVCCVMQRLLFVPFLLNYSQQLHFPLPNGNSPFTLYHISPYKTFFNITEIYVWTYNFHLATSLTITKRTQ